MVTNISTKKDNIVSIVTGAILRKNIDSEKKRYLITFADGSSILRKLVSQEAWAWVFRDFPSLDNYTEETIPPTVQAEMIEYEGESVATIKLSRNTFNKERAVLCPGIPFTSQSELATYLAEHGISVVEEYNIQLVS